MKTAHHTVLITGGSSGIGLALAQKFLSENNDVIVTGTNQEKLTHVQKAFPQIKVERADMRDTHALTQVVEKYPQVNVLVNNAGVQYNYNLAAQDTAIDLINRELQTNLNGPLQLIALLLPQLLAKKEAAIVNVSSSLGLVPKQSAPVYCGSKAGLRMVTKALRWQLEATNVKVFELIPPLVDTAMTTGRGEGKMSPEALAHEFWSHFVRDNYEIRIGKAKLLFMLQRIMPRMADKIMRKS